MDLSHQHGVELGTLDLDHVDGQVALGDASDTLELGAEAVDLGALLADDDARTSGEDDDLHLIAGALDLNAGDGGAARRFSRYLRISISLPRS